MEKKAFNELFERYLNNTITEADQRLLMKIVDQGEYDQYLEEKITVILEEKQQAETLDSAASEGILDFILAQKPVQTKAVPIWRNVSYRRLLISAAAMITIMLALAAAFLHTAGTNAGHVKQIQADKDSSILSYSGKQLIYLPDGSKIVLNQNSTIEYDKNSFNAKNREVRLSGEAYFDIKRNEKMPFIVHTGRISTKVLGTAFNINAFNNSDHIEVTVERGKVQVGDDQKIYGVITPDQQIKVSKSTLAYQQNNVKAEKVMVWKSNYLILDNIDMEQAIALISEKYKAPIKLANEDIKNCRITASFLNYEDLDHILKVICSVIEAEYHYNSKGEIILDGKGCQ